MSINSNPRVFPVTWLVEQRKAGKINTDIPIQRQPVWNHLHQSNLIMAMLHYVPISNLWFEKIGKGKNESYNVIDGKQRTLTLCSFVADVFPLSTKMRYKEVDGIDVSGMKFSELPYELQQRLLNYQLTFTMIDAMDAEQRSIVFFMGNQSVPLTDVHFLPVVLGEVLMKELNNLCQHPFMIDAVKLTKPALKKRADLKLIIQYLILKTEQDSGFGGKEIISFCDKIRAGEIAVPYREMWQLLDYLFEAIPKKFGYLKQIHIPIIMRVAEKAMASKMPANDFKDRLDIFFMDYEEGKQEEYAVACRQGSAKKANVQTRLQVMSGILKD